MGQVVENLLSNAFKYIEKENVSPRIDAGAVEQKNRKVFFVRDNGIGIEKKLRYFSGCHQDKNPARERVSD